MAKRFNRKNQKVTSHDTDLVFAAAVAAQRINNGYVKKIDENTFNMKISNVSLMIKILKDQSEILEEDRHIANEIRLYWQLRIWEILAETANSYITTIIAISNEDTVSSDNFAIMASMPYTYQRCVEHDIAKQKIENLLLKSRPVGAIGDKISNVMTLINRKYIMNYELNVYTVAFGDNLFEFWGNADLNIGGNYLISGKVKGHYNNITKLSYVKVKRDQI